MLVSAYRHRKASDDRSSSPSFGDVYPQGERFMFNGSSGQQVPFGQGAPDASRQDEGMQDAARRQDTAPQGSPVPPQSAYQAPVNTDRIPVSPQIRRAKSGRRPSLRGSVIMPLVTSLIGMAFGGVCMHFIMGKKPSSVVSNSDNGSVNIVASGDDVTLAEAVSAKVLPSVVSIDVYTNPFTGADIASTETKSGLGSGVIISNDGYILTNYHVVEGASNLVVNIDEDAYDARIVGTDPSSDLAVVKIEAGNLTPIEVGSSSDLVVGEWVLAAGSPYGLEKSVSTGIISALYRSTSMQSETGLAIYANMIQTDAAVNPGNSGGALVDSSGKLIGINTLIESASGSNSGVAFAIPVDYAMKVAEQLKNGEQVQHAHMGVSLATVNSQNYQSANLSVQSGAYIRQIEEGSPAANAGLQQGDVITKVNGTPVATASEAVIQVRSQSPGDTISIEYMRGDETRTADVTLTGATDEANGYNAGSQRDSRNSGSSGGFSFRPGAYDLSSSPDAESIAAA